MRLTMTERLRFALAPSRARRDALKTACAVAFILAAYALVGTLDYQDQLLAEKMAAEARYSEQQAAMLACLNGGAPGYYTLTSEGHRSYLVCDLYEVTDQNVTRRRGT